MTRLLLAFLLAGCTPWTRADTAAQVAVTATLAVDFQQTRSALADGGIEHNSAVTAISPVAYFAAAAVVLAGAAAALPRPWRSVLQGAAIAVQADTIAGNWVRMGRVW